MANQTYRAAQQITVSIQTQNLAHAHFEPFLFAGSYATALVQQGKGSGQDAPNQMHGKKTVRCFFDAFGIKVKQSATPLFYRVSGQPTEQGAAAKFFAQRKTWAQGPYPAQ